MAATAVFDADDNLLQKVAERILATLERLEKVFAAKELKVTADGSQVHSEVDKINARFASIAAQAKATGGAFGYIAGGASMVVAAVGAIATAITRIAGLIQYIPDSWGKWVPAAKQAATAYHHVADQIGVITGAANALRGRLSLVDAAFLGIHAHSLGASKGMATLAAVGGFAMSTLVAGARGAANAVGSLLGKVRSAIVGVLGLGMASAGAMLPLAAGGIGVTAVIGGLAAGIYQAMNAAGAFLDQSFNTGAAVGQLAVLATEFKNAGKAGEDVGPVISKMQRALETGKSNSMIAQLGLDMGELRKQTPVDQFHSLGTAINALGDPAERSAAAMAIFGKSGATLLSMFASKGFGDAAAQVGAQAGLLQKNAALFDDVSDKLGLAGVKTQGFFVGVADKLVPVLKPLIDRFATLDLAGMGQQVGELLAIAAQAVSDGSIGGIVMDALKLAFAGAGNFLAGVYLAMGPLLEHGLLAAAAAFVALMLDGVAQVLEGMSHVPGAGKLGGVASGVHGAAGAVRIFGAGEVGQAAAGVSRAMDAGKIFNTDGIIQSIGTKVAGVMANVKTQQDKALAEVPTIAPVTGGVQQLDNGGRGFSALQTLGGAFGRGAGTDPLIEANRLAREANDWLRLLATGKSGQEMPTGGSVYA